MESDDLEYTVGENKNDKNVVRISVMCIGLGIHLLRIFEKGKKSDLIIINSSGCELHVPCTSPRWSNC